MNIESVSKCGLLAGALLSVLLYSATVSPAKSAPGVSSAAALTGRIEARRRQLIDQQQKKPMHAPAKRGIATATSVPAGRKAPVWGNPYVSYLPQRAEPDYRYWRRVMMDKVRARARKTRNAPPTTFNRLIHIEDAEPNDEHGSAQPIAGAGTGTGTDNAIDINGSLGTSSPTLNVDNIEVTFPGADDGDIGKANATGLTNGVVGVARAVLGDGPHGLSGTGSGDFDFYRVTGLTRSNELHVDIDAWRLNGELDPMLAVYDASGNRLIQNDDSGGLDSSLRFAIPADGTYYIAVTAFGTGWPADPSDSSSGNGVGSFFAEGDYTLKMAVTPVTPLGSFDEIGGDDDGDIPDANVLNIAPDTAVRGEAVIGDGPHGSAGTDSGDVDMFAVSDVDAGDTITVNIPVEADVLDWLAFVYDSAGNIVVSHDGISVKQFSFDAPADGDYYIAVSGYPSALSDPFDSASGGGSGSEGPYTFVIERLQTLADTDYYAVDLAAGDVVGADIDDGSYALSLIAPDERLLIRSNQNATGILPADSPLVEMNSAVALTYVVPSDGTYVLKVEYARPGERIFGGGSYASRLRLHRAGLEAPSAEGRQILFLDFDGASIDAPALFGAGNSPATLSPLSAFLGNWGLAAGDEDAVIDAIVASVEESLEADLAEHGNNPYFDIRIRNSRDHDDPFGNTNVSRVIVGGSIDELGLSTIGIAESIDPGNYETEESAVVLLDLLSAAAGDPNSLNSVTLDPDAGIIDLIGVAVGNIVVHEAGHFFANFHTHQFNDRASIMDQGGNMAGMIGVGEDDIFGTADDEDVDLVEDVFVPGEGFSGHEDTTNLTAFGLGASGVPRITQPDNVLVTSDTPVYYVPLEIADSDDALEDLTVSAGTVDNELIRPDGLAVTGGGEKVLSINPVEGRSGTAEISLSVSDGISEDSTAFNFTVNAKPTIEVIEDQRVKRGGRIRNLPVLVEDGDGLPSALTLTVTAEDESLIPPGNLTLKETGAGYALDVVPATNMTGNSIVTISVSDGLETATTVFNVAVEGDAGGNTGNSDGGSGGGGGGAPGPGSLFLLMMLFGMRAQSARRGLLTRYPRPSNHSNLPRIALRGRNQPAIDRDA